MKRMIVAVGLFALGAPAADLIGRAPRRATELANPYENDSRQIQAGAKIFARECSACHPETRGGKGPRLNSPVIQDAAPGALFWVLRNGSSHRRMPSFAHLPEAQRWQIVSFLKERP